MVLLDTPALASVLYELSLHGTSSSMELLNHLPLLVARGMNPSLIQPGRGPASNLKQYCTLRASVLPERGCTAALPSIRLATPLTRHERASNMPAGT